MKYPLSFPSAADLWQGQSRNGSGAGIIMSQRDFFDEFLQTGRIQQQSECVANAQMYSKVNHGT